MSSWLICMPPGAPAWRELRRAGHRRRVGQLARPSGRSAAGTADRRDMVYLVRHLGRADQVDGVAELGPRKLAELADWRRHVVTLPYSEPVAIRWGELQASAEQRGRPRPVNDTWIAACCLVRDLPLVTLNVKDFRDFAEHDGLRVIGINER